MKVGGQRKFSAVFEKEQYKEIAKFIINNQYYDMLQTYENTRLPANKKRFWNVRLWLYEGLGELNVLRMLYQRSTLVI